MPGLLSFPVIYEGQHYFAWIEKENFNLSIVPLIVYNRFVSHFDLVTSKP